MTTNILRSAHVTMTAMRFSRFLTRRLGLMVAAIAVCWSTEVKAQLVGYDFTGLNQTATATATTTNAGLDSSYTLSRGAGATASSGANSFRTVGFKNDGISIANTDYYTFALSATPGNTLSVTSINAIYNGTTTYLTTSGVTGVLTQFAYSIDGGAFTLIGNATNVTAYNTQYAYDLSGVSALQNVVDTSTVTFRFYASGQTTTGGFGFYSPASGTDGLDIYGTVPEPATYLGGFLLVGALGWNHRRRLGGLAGLLWKPHAA